jgi:hypothetical protein
LAESLESSVVRIFCFYIPTCISQEDEGEGEEHETMSDNEFWGCNKEDVCGKCNQIHEIVSGPFQKWYTRDPNDNTFHVHVWCLQCCLSFYKTLVKAYEVPEERDEQDVVDLIPQQGFLYCVDVCLMIFHSYDLCVL